jgi:outer membrane protein assembly factor BamB
MKTKTLLITATRLVALLFLFTSCERGSAPTDPLDSDAEIITFSLKRADGTAFTPAELIFSLRSDSILFTLPAGTDITRLIPDISIRGAKVLPASGTMQNFSAPIVYTVTAEDVSVHRYVVVVSVKKSNSMVYIGTSDNYFHAIDATSGALLWQYRSEGSRFSLSSPTYYNGTIYVGAIDRNVYAFDPATGAIRWQHQLPEGIESDAVVADGILYVGCNDDHLYALNAADGSMLWKFRTGANISSSPVISEGKVYFGSSDGNLYALQARTGIELWHFRTNAMINQSGACLVNGLLYFGSRDAHLYAVEAATGTLKWKYAVPNGVSLEQSSPTVANGVVYMAGWYNIADFSQKGSVFALNALTGALVWESLTNTGFSSSPCIDNGKLFISGDDMNFYALNALDGSTIWRQQILPNGASAAVADGTVFVGGGGTSHIYAFDAANGSEKWRFHTRGLSTSDPLVLNENGIAVHAGPSGALQ